MQQSAKSKKKEWNWPPHNFLNVDPRISVKEVEFCDLWNQLLLIQISKLPTVQLTILWARVSYHKRHYRRLSGMILCKDCFWKKLPILSLWPMMHFHHQYASVHIAWKLTYNAKGLVAQDQDITSFLINFFLRLWRKYHSHTTCWKLDILIHILVIYGQSKVGLQSFSALVIFCTVSLPWVIANSHYCVQISFSR